MNRQSKWFDNISAKSAKAGRRRAAADDVQPCQHPGCDAPGTHKAPKGRGREGEFYTFCIDHVREYNKSYNYFNGMAPEDVVAYQRDSQTGHRPTWKLGQNAGKRRKKGTAHIDDPFDVFPEEAAASASARRPRRTVLASHRHAFETLDLDEAAERQEIRARFKALVKRHHPDVNGGDRSSEHRLREIIQAYNTLKSAGFC